MEICTMFKIMIGIRFLKWKLNNNAINYSMKPQSISIQEKAIYLMKKLLRLLMNNKLLSLFCILKTSFT